MPIDMMPAEDGSYLIAGLPPGDFIVRSVRPRAVVIEMTEQHQDFTSFAPETRKFLVPLAE